MSYLPVDRMPNMVEHRAIRGGEIMRPYIMGQGQQLARQGYASKAAAVEAYYAHLPYPTGPNYLPAYTTGNDGARKRTSLKLGEQRRAARG